ncbi:MAG: family 65 glycosyl hydrolase, partial [Bacillales bacterium]|nr:family 65 glycosyl hydrolase [Bacillales bacterium]
DLPHLEINSIPENEFPLYAHWSYDRIYRNDMIKQPDVLMLMFLYPDDFPKLVKKANYDYYEPRTIHESSLSPSVHSILATELGYHQQALDFFSYACRLDLDDYNNNTSEGLHITSIAAAWVNIVYGFAGLKTSGTMPSLSPYLPKLWKSYSFFITLFGNNIKIKVTKENIYITNNGNPFTFKIYGIPTEINTGTTTLKNERV